jgi:hypothetical protein
MPAAILGFGRARCAAPGGGRRFGVMSCPFALLGCVFLKKKNVMIRWHI